MRDDDDDTLTMLIGGAGLLLSIAVPMAFLVTRNYTGMAITGAIWIVIGLAVFTPQVLSSRSELLFLRPLFIIQGAVFGGVGGWVLVQPPDPWTHAIGSAPTHLALDAPNVYGVEFSEVAPQFFVHTADRRGFKGEPIPKALAPNLGIGADGTILAREAQSPAQWLRGADGHWRRHDTLDGVTTYARSGVTLFATAQSRLWRISTPDSKAEPVSGVAPVTTVCANGERVLAVRSQNAPEQRGRAWQSEDGGVTFKELPNVAAPAERCAISEDGWVWLGASGYLIGDLHFVAPNSFTPVFRRTPAPQLCALTVNPKNGREVWIAISRAGVFRSQDGAATWRYEGLRGFEVQDLVVDFKSGRAYAGTSSGIYEMSFE